MSSSKENAQDSQIFFCDDGGRPHVDEPDQTGDIYVKDWVRFVDPARGGSFQVTTVVDGKYKLQDEQRVSLENGKLFEESELELED